MMSSSDILFSMEEPLPDSVVDSLLEGVDASIIEKNMKVYREYYNALSYAFGTDLCPSRIFHIPFLGVEPNVLPEEATILLMQPSVRVSAAHDRIICALTIKHGLENAPQVPNLALILLHNRSEAETFSLMNDLILRSKASTKSLPPLQLSAIAEKSLVRVFRTLVKALDPELHAHMESLGQPVKSILTDIFRGFFTGFLPPRDVQRVVEAFLTGSSLLLFRYCYALLQLAKPVLLHAKKANEWDRAIRSVVIQGFRPDHIRSPPVTGLNELSDPYSYSLLLERIEQQPPLAEENFLKLYQKYLEEAQNDALSSSDSSHQLLGAHSSESLSTKSVNAYTSSSALSTLTIVSDMSVISSGTAFKKSWTIPLVSARTSRLNSPQFERQTPREAKIRVEEGLRRFLDALAAGPQCLPPKISSLSAAGSVKLTRALLERSVGGERLYASLRNGLQMPSFASNASLCTLSACLTVPSDALEVVEHDGSREPSCSTHPNGFDLELLYSSDGEESLLEDRRTQKSVSNLLHHIESVVAPILVFVQLYRPLSATSLPPPLVLEEEVSSDTPTSMQSPVLGIYLPNGIHWPSTAGNGFAFQYLPDFNLFPASNTAMPRPVPVITLSNLNGRLSSASSPSAQSSPTSSASFNSLSPHSNSHSTSSRNLSNLSSSSASMSNTYISGPPHDIAMFQLQSTWYSHAMVDFYRCGGQSHLSVIRPVRVDTKPGDVDPMLYPPSEAKIAFGLQPYGPPLLEIFDASNGDKAKKVMRGRVSKSFLNDLSVPGIDSPPSSVIVPEGADRHQIYDAVREALSVDCGIVAIEVFTLKSRRPF